MTSDMASLCVGRSGTLRDPAVPEIAREALNNIRHARNSYIQTLAALTLIRSPAIETLRNVTIVLKADGITFHAGPEDLVGDRVEVPLSQIVDTAQNTPAERDADLEEFHQFARRNLFKEAYEACVEFAKQSCCYPSLSSAPWFHYARLIRGAVTHDRRFKFSPSDRKALPVSWRGKSILASDEGKEMRREMLDPITLISLITEMEGFVGRDNSCCVVGPHDAHPKRAAGHSSEPWLFPLRAADTWRRVISSSTATRMKSERFSRSSSTASIRAMVPSGNRAGICS